MQCEKYALQPANGNNVQLSKERLEDVLRFAKFHVDHAWKIEAPLVDSSKTALNSKHDNLVKGVIQAIMVRKYLDKVTITANMCVETKSTIGSRRQVRVQLSLGGYG